MFFRVQHKDIFNVDTFFISFGNRVPEEAVRFNIRSIPKNESF